MPPPSESRKSDYLCEQYVSGNMTDVEAEELRLLLRRDPSLGRKLLDHLDMNVLLDEVLPSVLAKPEPKPSWNPPDWSQLKSEGIAKPIPENTQNEPTLRPGKTAGPSKGRQVLTKPRFTDSLEYRAALALLVVFLFAFAVFLEFGPQSSSGVPSSTFRPLATVRAAVDVLWSPDMEPLKPGQQIESGRIAFESGTLELVLSNDVRLALEGPVDFQLHSPLNSFCGRGKLSATVPPTGKGFEVVTPLTTVVDLGTEFFVDVAAEAVKTHTITGKIELSRLPEGKRELVGGNAGKIDFKGKIDQFPADPSVFLKKEDVREKVIRADNVFLKNWREQSAVWNADPGLRVRFDFEGRGNRVGNLAPKASHGSAVLNGAVRTQGRWHGKSAVDFRTKRHSVDFTVPEELASFTLFISARIDSLNRFNQTLLASRTSHEGGIVWQLWNDGSIQLSVNGAGAAPPTRFNAPRVISRSRWGAWHTIATVSDAERKTVSHYFEGKKVAEIPIERLVFVRMNDVTLGNALIEEKKTTDRSFDGAVDEFLLFARALSDAEIRKLHESGR